MEKILEAININKTYPGVIALDNVNFNVYKAKVNVLVGENGAGKSTLMKILSGVEKQTSGDLFLNNKKLEINSTKDAEENSIGIIHQELNFFPNLSVHENILLMGSSKCQTHANYENGFVTRMLGRSPYGTLWLQSGPLCRRSGGAGLGRTRVCFMKK